MGIWDTITELVEAAAPWSVAEAEAPAQQEEEKVSGLIVEKDKAKGKLLGVQQRHIRNFDATVPSIEDPGELRWWTKVE